jgi:hypothetical protein
MRKQRQQRKQKSETDRGKQQSQRYHACCQRRQVGRVGGFPRSPQFETEIGDQQQIGEDRAREFQYPEIPNPENSRQVNERKKVQRLRNEVTGGQTGDILERVSQGMLRETQNLSWPA